MQLRCDRLTIAALQAGAQPDPDASESLARHNQIDDGRLDYIRLWQPRATVTLTDLPFWRRRRVAIATRFELLRMGVDQIQAWSAHYWWPVEGDVMTLAPLTNLPTLDRFLGAMMAPWALRLFWAETRTDDVQHLSLTEATAFMAMLPYQRAATYNWSVVPTVGIHAPPPVPPRDPILQPDGTYREEVDLQALQGTTIDIGDI